MIPMTTSESDNARLMREAFASLQRHDLDACTALMTPDFVINIAGMPAARRGIPAWRRHARTMLTAFPDVRLSLHDVVAAGDRVAVRMTLSGTHQGEFMGIRATGRRVEYESSEIYRIEGGLIAEEWICSDMMTLLSQLGEVSTTKLAAMYFSGYRFWCGAALGGLAGLAIAGRRRG